MVQTTQLAASAVGFEPRQPKHADSKTAGSSPAGWAGFAAVRTRPHGCQQGAPIWNLMEDRELQSRPDLFTGPVSSRGDGGELSGGF